MSLDPPILAVPEYTGEQPPVLDVPEFNGSVNGDLDDPLILPRLMITKWVDEYGNELKPTDAKSPSVEGEANEAYEPGFIEGYEFIKTLSVDDNGIVTHVFRKIQTEKEYRKLEDSNRILTSNQVEELPQTGTGQEFAIFGVAASSILAGLGLVIPGKQKKG